MIFDLIVIGGGAAGFFGAIQAKTLKPGLSVLILEKSTKLLSKVRVSGGGRCNVTHHCYNPFELSRHYPRGEKQVKKLFQRYGAEQVRNWFSEKRVQLKVEEDGRMFPTSDRSQTIIDCFLEEAEKQNIRIITNSGVTSLAIHDGHIEIEAGGTTYEAKKVLVAIGGSAKAEGYAFLSKVGHTILSPIPSLFTFNSQSNQFQDLMGISMPDAEVKIASSKYVQRGPLLITHWGLSGPAVIRLSAWAAQFLNEKQYIFDALINWIGLTEDDCREGLLKLKEVNPKQKITKNPDFTVPLRLWQRLCELSGIEEDRVYGDISMKQLNRLVEYLTHCVISIKGKTTFKEEFVTCGGIDLNEVNLETLESKIVPNLYFAGEVLNIDGETGGFNFQAAWTTGYVAAESICHP
ncbi:MAG: NAD(P)/FAD-dependent oxidoreductase [Chryseolinea sp.]